MGDRRSEFRDVSVFGLMGDILRPRLVLVDVEAGGGTDVKMVIGICTVKVFISVFVFVFVFDP